MDDIIKALVSDKPGFAPILVNDRWTLAMIRDEESMHLENVQTISRHTETDEVFVLLEGSACIYAGQGENKRVKLLRHELESGKAFVVPAGTWHSTVTRPGCKILVVENSGTGSTNTQRLPVNHFEIEV